MRLWFYTYEYNANHYPHGLEPAGGAPKPYWRTERTTFFLTKEDANREYEHIRLQGEQGVRNGKCYFIEAYETAPVKTETR